MQKNKWGHCSLQLVLCLALLCGTVPAWAQNDVAKTKLYNGEKKGDRACVGAK